MQVQRYPARIRTHIGHITLEYDPARPKPSQYTLKAIAVTTVSNLLSSGLLNPAWLERCRSDTDEIEAAGGLGTLMYVLECENTGTGERPLDAGG
jgi:hypothetical protein